MTADAWKVYNSLKEFIGDNTIDLDAGDAYFREILVDSGYTPDLTHQTYANVSGDELATAYGYTVGGKSLANAEWSRTAGTCLFNSDTVAWLANGGSIVARYAILVHVAAGSGVPQSTDKLLAYCLMDNAPADITATAGGILSVAPNANGYFDFSGGDS